MVGAPAVTPTPPTASAPAPIAADQLDAVLTELATAGFDLAHRFDAAIAAREAGWHVLTGAPRLGILIGNTRALWPPFVAAMADDTTASPLAAERDPLERYTERTIAAAFPGAPTLFAHRRYGAAFLPFQRLAVATGLGALAPTQLVIHPRFGPWFALRAVVVVDGAPPVTAPIAKPCVCAAACPAALAHAQGQSSWQAWLAVRDACSLRAARYADDQIRYHYTHAWPTATT